MQDFEKKLHAVFVSVHEKVKKLKKVVIIKKKVIIVIVYCACVKVIIKNSEKYVMFNN